MYLQHLQHLHRLSDEAVVARWVENPYFQHFTGEIFFQHKPPIHLSSLSRWRDRIGDEGAEWLLTKTIEAGRSSGVVDDDSLSRVSIDTAAMEKNIAYPTDARLYEKARAKLVALAHEAEVQRTHENRRSPCPMPPQGAPRRCHLCCPLRLRPQSPQEPEPHQEAFDPTSRHDHQSYSSSCNFWAESFPEPDTAATSNSSKADLQWGWANEEVEEQASGIEHAIYWARCEVENDTLDYQNFLQQLDDGVAASDLLIAQHGLDLRGVFRRRALVPFILVPRAVAARHGNAEKLSMLTNLKQAHDAFIFGTPYSALALMRSIMEAVLRNHYRAEGNDLSERIRNARGRLPRVANEVATHRLRALANAILHLDPSKENEVLKMDEVRLEKEIVSLLFVLRALIEAGR